MKHFYILILILITACTSKVNPVTTSGSTATGEVEFIFTPKSGDQYFCLDKEFTNSNQEKFLARKLKFFISSVGFSGSTTKEQQPITRNDQGVFLVDTDSLKNNSAVLKFKIAKGAYTDVRFNIGVPREANHGDPSRAKYPLDLGQTDLFWEWNSGYIFFLMDGNTPENADKLFHFAIGNDDRTIAYSFGNLFDIKPLVEVKENKTTRVYFTLDIDKLFKNGDGSPYSLKTPESAIVHGGYKADLLALNLKHAMTLDSVRVK